MLLQCLPIWGDYNAKKKERLLYNTVTFLIGAYIQQLNRLNDDQR